MRTILSIQPDGQRLGYAVFKDASLKAFGTKNLGKGTLGHRIHRIAMPFFRSMVREHEPDLIVLPHPTVRRGTGRNRFLRALRYELDRAPCATKSISRNEIKLSFGSVLKLKRPSKDRIMKALAEWFPNLLLYLPKPRRSWEPQDYWYRMFDAVSLAVTYLHQL